MGYHLTNGMQEGELGNWWAPIITAVADTTLKYQQARLQAKLDRKAHEQAMRQQKAAAAAAKKAAEERAKAAVSPAAAANMVQGQPGMLTQQTANYIRQLQSQAYAAGLQSGQAQGPPPPPPRAPVQATGGRLSPALLTGIGLGGAALLLLLMRR